MRRKLTLKTIDSLEVPEAGYALYWDAELPNFGVRVTSGGVRSYVIQRRVLGKERRITIGRCNVLQPDKARNEARGMLGDISRGKDPQAERASKIAASVAKGHTLAALMQAYADNLRARGKKRTAKDAEYAVKSHLNEAHPRIAKTPARNVTSREIATVIRSLAEKGKLRRAGMLRSYMFAAYNLAMRAESDPSVPSALIAYGVTASPVLGVATVKGGVTARKRVLSDDELQAFLPALEAYEGVARDALMLAFLAGGQRIQQVLRLAPTDVDDDGIIRLIDTKGRRAEPREHFVPLADRGKALALKLAEKAREAKSALLFTSDGETPVRLETISTTVFGIAEKLKEAEKCAELFQARDLRRTAETRLAALGVSKDLRAQLLSHGLSGIQAKHYDKHDYVEEKRRALVAWEQHLADVMEGKTKKDGKVTSIRRKRA